VCHSVMVGAEPPARAWPKCLIYAPCLIANFIVYYNERPEFLFSSFFLAPATTYPQGPRAGTTGQSQRRSRRGRGRSPWRGLVIYSAAFGPASNLSPSSFCLSSAFGRSFGDGATRRRQRAWHERKQLRLRPRSQPPPRPRISRARKTRHYTRERNAVLSAELGAALRAALLPAGRLVIPQGPRSGVAGQSQRNSRRCRGCSP
jgi:hypothetical protein